MEKRNESNKVEILLQSILITLLAQSGVSQKEIKKIVGVGSSRVNDIAKNIKKTKGEKDE